MTDKEILDLLKELAPLIQWKIYGQFIEGTTIINRKTYSYAAPKVMAEDKVRWLAQQFLDDYERKKKQATND